MRENYEQALASETDVGKRIKLFRNLYELTQGALSTISGIDRSTIAFYETGQIAPSTGRICRLAASFCLSLDEFMGEAALQSVLYDKQAELENSPMVPQGILDLETEEKILLMSYRQLEPEDKKRFLSEMATTLFELHKLQNFTDDEDVYLVPKEELHLNAEDLDDEDEDFDFNFGLKDDD